MSKIIAGNIKIAENDVERLFQEVKDNHDGLGFWSTRDTADKSDDWFVMPNGLILDRELARRWINFYNTHDSKA